MENQEYQDEAEIEEGNIELYRRIFTSTHSYPTHEKVEYDPPIYEAPDPVDEKKISFMALMGLEAVFFVIATGSGAIYAALRTSIVLTAAEYAVLSATGWNGGVVNALSLIAGITLLLAVEGYLMAYGFWEGKSKKKLSTSPRAMYICLAVSAIAGTLSISHLSSGVDKDWAWLLWVINGVISVSNVSLVLLSGVGISYVVYCGSQNIGILYNVWMSLVKEKMDAYTELEKVAKNKFNENLVYYKAIYEKQVAAAREKFQEEVQVWEQKFEKDYREKGREIIFKKGRYSIQGKQGSTTQETIVVPPALTERQQVINWLVENSLTAHDVGNDKPRKPAELAALLNIKGDNVRNILKRLRDELRSVGINN